MKKISFVLGILILCAIILSGCVEIKRAFGIETPPATWYTPSPPSPDSPWPKVGPPPTARPSEERIPGDVSGPELDYLKSFVTPFPTPAPSSSDLRPGQIHWFVPM